MDIRRTARRSLTTVSLTALLAALAAACTPSSPPPADECGYVQNTESITAPASSDSVTTIAGQCLTRSPDVHDDGTPECIVIEARKASTCDCAAPGRMPVPDAHQGAIDATEALADPATWDCFCELVALTGDAQKACREDADSAPSLDGEPVQGYCYLDDELGIGNPEITDHCLDGSKHLVRLAGDVAKPSGQTLVFFCAAKVCNDGS